jgi:hypothetical protein
MRKKTKENGIPAFAGMTEAVETVFSTNTVMPAQMGIPFVLVEV